jgi:hypothetical protein
MKKSKSSTSISAMFGKMNRSSRDLSYAPQQQAQPHGKENTTPPDSGIEPADTPIWAQFASADNNTSRTSEENKSTRSVQDEIDRYTPQDYSPGKQRNFNGTTTARQPSLRPAAKQRPHSTIIVPTDGFIGALSRKVSSARSSMEIRRSEDSARRISKDELRNPVDRPKLTHRHSERSDRKISGSSTEQAPVKEKLNIMKRGARVMAAVAALQGTPKSTAGKEEAVLDPKTVDREFEAVLASRNVPEPMRERMRTLTLRVKADFVRQDQGASKTADGTAANTPQSVALNDEAEQRQQAEDDSKSTKRSRARSRTFTFSKGDKRGDTSPSKKPRERSKARPMAINIPKGQSTSDLTTPTTPTGASWGRRGHATPAVSEYISYLKKTQDPKKVEVGRLHKLRILLRNETVAWVDGFVSQGGMAEVVSLLHRLMTIEWREEHEDQLLHEGLLCLKGLCTTERALAELDMVADELFPALLGMLFDEEKKGPAEYTTRTIIINILCKCDPLARMLVDHLLTTCNSHLPVSTIGQLGLRAGGTSTQGPHIPGRTKEARNRQTCRLRLGHACPTAIQALEPRSFQCHQRSFLDLLAPPQRRASA